MAEKQANKLDAPVSSGTLVDDSKLIELMEDIPEFTPEQWALIKAKAARYEQGFKPTSTLFDGL